ncbi:tripartite tricarboxylate transporter TctB family protein [Actinophytocola sp.]|uniref:tripartite tricarboxylate transporter TctB family protein n=1 Tax=Actinophytocola sp. TaxID=1872138 RepID=UPI0025C211B0|nr:tripartite tricarboxylate transporter TctB family protein [Actinophytocola sp.]
MPSPQVRERGIAGLAWSAVPALIAFAVAGVFLLRADTITGPEATYPIVLAVAVLVIGAVNLVRDLLTRPATEDGPAAVPRLLAFIVVLLAALLLLEPAGFFPTMVVLVVGSLVCFGVRNPLVIAAATALIVGSSYLVFVRLLVVPFPPGFLGLT